jgi:hypothetical protein
MSSVTYFQRRSALSKMVGKAGGKSVLAALRDADKATVDLREEGHAILLEALAELEAKANGAPSPDWLEAVYLAASTIIDVCPPELPGLHKAVYSLCDLTDRQIRSGRLEREPIAVHIAALRPLSQSDQAPEAVSAILDGLAALQARDIARAGG